jgi:hypothetical protein
MRINTYPDGTNAYTAVTDGRILRRTPFVKPQGIRDREFDEEQVSRLGRTGADHLPALPCGLGSFTHRSLE